MKNHSIILTAILSLSLLACGTDEMTAPVVNAALAGADDKAVTSFILGGEPGIPIQAAPKYGSYVDGNFVEKKNPTDQKQTPLLQIAGDKDKVYHNINADAKILLAHNAAEVLYLNPTKLETSGAALKTALEDVKDITYTGLANAEWENSVTTGTGSLDTDGTIKNVRYYKEQTATADEKTAFGKVKLAEKETAYDGTVTVVVDSEGKAKITPAGIRKSDDSETFGWDADTALNYSGAAVTEGGNGNIKTMTAGSVWKPAADPVIEISADGVISSPETDDYTLGTAADAPQVIFLGEGTTSQVGGLINLTYTIDEQPKNGSAAQVGFVKVSDAGSWKTNLVSGDKIAAGLYYTGSNAVIISGALKLAFVAHVAAAE